MSPEIDIVRTSAAYRTEFRDRERKVGRNRRDTTRLSLTSNQVSRNWKRNQHWIIIIAGN